MGEPFKIRLWEDRTRGSRWMPLYDAVSIRLVGDDYQRTRNIRVDDVGMRYFEFVALRPGAHEIRLELRYGWKFSSEERVAYHIEASDRRHAP